MRVGVLVLTLWSGCTATIASLQIEQAAKALALAEAKGAPEQATYEYTLARRYLEKAREEALEAETGAAEALARQSEVWSDRAIAFVAKGARPGIQLDELPDFESLPERELP